MLCALALLSACVAPDHALERDRAARNGIAWMIRNAARMPVGWVHPFLQRLYRVVPDPALRGQLAAVLVSDLGNGRHVSLSEALDPERDLAPARLSPMLYELDRRKQMALPWKSQRDAIQGMVAQHRERFFDALEPTQRIVYSHLFRELDIHPREELGDLIAEMRGAISKRPPAEVAADLGTMYAITHLIYARSDYFRAYVHAAEFAFAHRSLEQVLRSWVAGQRDDHVMDLVAEVLVCHQLMRRPEDEHTTAARRILNERQNEDGSWGGGRPVGRRQTHATLGGVMANLVFPDPLHESMPPP